MTRSTMPALARQSSDADRPYLNLMPAVDLLVSEGNSLMDGGFLNTQGGWCCRFVKPLDLERIAEEFSIPDSIVLSPNHDTILDKLSWCAIEGPGAHPS